MVNFLAGTVSDTYESLFKERSRGYFPFGKRSLFIFLIIMIPIDIAVYTIAAFGYSIVDSTSNQLLIDIILPLITPSRFVMALLGPLITFLIYYAIILIFFYDESLKPGFNHVFEYTLAGGILSLLLAITLNSRAFLVFVISLTSIRLDPRLITFTIFAVIGPFIEETAKALPIFFMARGLTTIKGTDKTKRILSSGKLPVFAGLTTGVIFNLLETYWYIFNSGYIFDLGERSAGWDLIALQLLIRALNPIHILAAGISGYGIALVLWKERTNNLNFDELKYAFSALGLAVVIHGLWNGYLVYAEYANVPLILILGNVIPVFNVIFMFVSLIVLGLLVYRVSKFTDDTCSYCGNWHSPPYDRELHKSQFYPKISFWNRFLGAIWNKKTTYTCLSCKSLVVDDKCTGCNAAMVYACSSCNVPIPVYSKNCWKCNQNLIPVFDSVLNYRRDWVEDISTGFLLIFTAFYVPMTFAMIIYYSQNLGADVYGIVIVYLSIFSILYLLAIKWIKTENRRAMGTSLARTIFAMVIIQLGLLLILFSALTFAIGLFISGILFLLESFILIVFAKNIVFGFQPLFHQSDMLEREEDI